MKKLMTLVIVYNDEKILLAMKKRGFGTGRWNGYGGKVLKGETIEQSAMREFEEESGVVPKNLTNRGLLTFTFGDNDDELETHLFSVDDSDIEVIETEEMKPQWFLHSEIPFEEMWSDDPHWLPLVLSGKNVKARFHFDNADSQNILNKSVEEYD